MNEPLPSYLHMIDMDSSWKNTVCGQVGVVVSTINGVDCPHCLACLPPRCAICKNEIKVMTPPKKDICSQNCLKIQEEEGAENERYEIQERLRETPTGRSNYVAGVVPTPAEGSGRAGEREDPVGRSWIG